MKNSGLAKIRAILFAVFLLPAGMPLAAATRADAAQAGAAQPGAASTAAPDILVLIDPARNGETFGALMADAAKYKLSDVGLAAQVETATSTDAAAPIPRTRASGAAAALVCRYRVDGQQMAVTLEWHDAQTGAPAVIVQAAGQIDLHLDSVILAALDDMLARVKDRIIVLSSRHAGNETSAKDPPADPPQGLVAPIGTGASRLPAVSRPVAPSFEATRRFLLSAGFAPFLPTGTASYYFGLGYLPSLLASYFLDTPVGPVGIGVLTGMDYFYASGVQDSSVNYLIPLGLDVRYEMGGGILHPFFHVAGGPAFLIMVTGTRGTLVDVLPFLKSGIGLELTMASWMGVALLADYDVYFEMPYLLTGFTPSVNMVFHP